MLKNEPFFVAWVGKHRYLPAAVPAVALTLCPLILLQMVTP